MVVRGGTGVKLGMVRLHLVALGLALVAFLDKDPVVGTWTSVPENHAQTDSEELVYRANGTFSATYVRKSGSKVSRTTSTGTWKRLDGNKFVQKVSDIGISLKGFSDVEAREKNKQWKQMKKAAIEQFNKQTSITILVKGKKLTMTGATGSTTYVLKG